MRKNSFPRSLRSFLFSLLLAVVIFQVVPNHGRVTETHCPSGSELELHQNHPNHGDVCRFPDTGFVCPPCCASQIEAPYCHDDLGRPCRTPCSFESHRQAATTNPENDTNLHAEFFFTSTNNHLKNTSDSNPKHPFFWHIPKSGGTTIKNLMLCMRFIGVEHFSSVAAVPSLEVVPFRQRRVVNINVNTPEGVKHGAFLGLTENHMEDFIATALFRHPVEYLFDENSLGSAFSVFRHPVDRASSMFHYLGKAYWETTYNPSLKNMTLVQYYQKGDVEHDWMVRQLTGKINGVLGPSDLEESKRIISQHVLVGLMDELDESVRRFGLFFGWQTRPQWGTCSEKTRVKANSNAHDKIVEGGPEWQAIVNANPYDVKLYDHAVRVFQDQASLFPSP